MILVPIFVQIIATFLMSMQRKQTFEIKQKSDGSLPTNTTDNVATEQPLFLPISGKEIAKDHLILICKTLTKQTCVWRHSARLTRGLVPTPRIMHKGFSKEKMQGILDFIAESDI